MTKLIATHSGTFHCDESLAVFLLRILPEYKDSKLVRTRDPARLAEADIVVDVGGVYDHAAKRYDHHQRGFEESFGHGFVTKLSSAGLVYKHYGEQILSEIIGSAASKDTVSLLYTKVYQDFVEAIDGIDNGISAQSGPSLYRSRTDLSSRVGQLNPRWNEEYSDPILDARFEQAAALTGKEFLERVDYLSKAWLPARQLVQTALESRKSQVNESGKIMQFNQSLPWKEHLFELEETLQIAENEKAYYVLYPESSEKPDANWRVQAVPVSSDSFDSRKPLPEAWRGVRDDKLSELTGIDGCIFVHASGFIGGNKSKAGALAVAKAALKI